jgi:hypothetical protein
VKLQETARELQVTIPNLLALGAFLLSLFILFIIYTEVETLLLYIRRWRRLNLASTPAGDMSIEAPASEEESQPDPIA